MRRAMSSLSRKVVIGAVAGLVALTPLVGPATAAPTGAAGPDLHVTEAQKRELDRQIAERLKVAPGGERIGVNEIAWRRDGEIVMITTFPVPGESVARASGEPITPLGTPNCPYEHVCLWDNTNFGGERSRAFYTCRTENLASFGWANRAESWQNNQTPNTKSFLVRSGQILMDMIPNSKVSHVGVHNVNRATHLTVC